MIGNVSSMGEAMNIVMEVINMCNYNENMCETCVFAKFDCWYPMGGKVVAGWDDKGAGIIVACKNYEKDDGQSIEYEKEYIKNMNMVAKK